MATDLDIKFLAADVSGFNKALSVMQAVTNAALSVMQLINELPRTGKRNRNIFRKTYNRRPGNKQKRAFVRAKMGLSAVMGASQVHLITSQPIPKYYPEGGIVKGGPAIVGEEKFDFKLAHPDGTRFAVPKPINYLPPDFLFDPGN